MTARRALLPLLLLAGAGALLYNLYMQSRPAAPTTPDENLPRYTLDDVDWVRYDFQGQPSLKGHAANIDYFSNQQATGDKLAVTLLRPRGTPWTATADSGIMPAGEKRIRLDGKVKVNGQWPDNSRAMQIDTTQLWIDPQTHELFTDAGVTLHSSGRDGSATGLRADWMTQTVNLYADVRMTYDRSTH